MDKSVIDILTDLPLFDALSGSELKVVSRHMRISGYSAGETIFQEGAAGDSVCYIVHGEVAVVKRGGEGAPRELARLGRGRSIGEMSLIDDAPRSATAEARTDVVLVFLSRRDFDTIVEAYPRIGIKILKGLARLLSINLRKTSSRLLEYMLPMG